MIDPFVIKRRSRLHPVRVAYTLYARGMEALARVRFERCALPRRVPALDDPAPTVVSNETAVTTDQLHVLLTALDCLELSRDHAIVEVGAYRGATTHALAVRTQRRVFAVDPFIGYGGWEADFAAFRARTASLPNVTHLRMTSGEAARTWAHGPIGFVFIDAVHDYVNAAFDVAAWTRRLSAGGLLALHDTDTAIFAGARMAAFEARKRAELWAHIDNLTVLRKRGS